MKRYLSAISLLICLGSVVAGAQDKTDYHEWMKEVGSTHSALRKSLKSESGSAAADDATKLAGIFDQVGQFWQKRNASDAVMFASAAASGFKQVADFASAGRFNEASAVLKSTQATCSGCHKAHRALSLHGEKIK